MKYQSKAFEKPEHNEEECNNLIQELERKFEERKKHVSKAYYLLKCENESDEIDTQWIGKIAYLSEIIEKKIAELNTETKEELNSMKNDIMISNTKIMAHINGFQEEMQEMKNEIKSQFSELTKIIQKS